MTIDETKELHIYTDGGSRGNPGSAAIGIVIRNKDKETLHEISKTLGIATNNIAEYTAVKDSLLYLVNKLQSKTCEVRLSFFLDSELVVRQLTGLYKIRDPNLAILANEIRKFEASFLSISYTHIRRELNKEADLLVNKALDAKSS
ncbi:MAG: ribonuclease HI family protein [bacterium]|nr:ribonuclease HI family protein [bacterium]